MGSVKPNKITQHVSVAFFQSKSAQARAALQFYIYFIQEYLLNILDLRSPSALPTLTIFIVVSTHF